jgi:very-short-patch-repair endonuclease
MVRRSLSPELHEEILHQRKYPTKAETILWNELRNHGLAGHKFRRQHPAGGYILDFYCPEVKLAIEVDGGIHRETSQKAYDEQRTQDLANLGIQVIRFWNSEVESNLEVVLQRIKAEIKDKRG